MAAAHARAYQDNDLESRRGRLNGPSICRATAIRFHRSTLLALPALLLLLIPWATRDRGPLCPLYASPGVGTALGLCDPRSGSVSPANYAAPAVPNGHDTTGLPANGPVRRPTNNVDEGS